MGTTKTNTTKTKPVIKLEDVLKIYEGKAGHCCCGCSGKYYYQEQTREAASKDRGYPVKDDEINDNKVKSRVSLMNRMIADVEGTVFVDPNEDYISIETEMRIRIAYLKK